MKGMSIAAITKACNGEYYGDSSIWNEEISSITTDSRTAEQGCLFVAIKGERSDGHDYIASCLKQGALCCISERELTKEKEPYIKVDSAKTALQDLAKLYRAQLSVKVVGITGSVGKTSTKETIASVLSQKYRVLKTQGNYNNEIGVPLTIFRIRPEDEVAVLEMGISDFGEMRRLTAMVQPDICVITNIGLCHLENLKSRSGILQAKTEIFEGMRAGGTAVLNGDDDMLQTIGTVCGKKPIFFGMEQSCSVYANQIENMGLEGMSAVIHSDCNERMTVHIPIAGKHMVYNVLAAAAVGECLGLTQEQIKKGVECLETISGRNHLIRTKNCLVLDDCYNANPVSMKAGIDVIDTAKGRKICVLGDMFELGEDEVRLHREVGQYLAEKSIDFLLTAGSLAKYISEGAASYQTLKKDAYPCEIRTFDDKQGLLSYLKSVLQSGDSVLVKASHGMGFSEIVEALKEY